MIRIIKIIIFSIIVLIVSNHLFSCKKINQARVKGNWELVDFTNTATTYQEWIFYKGGNLTINVTYFSEDSIPYTVTETGIYKFKTSKKMIIEGFSSPTTQAHNTTWDIMDISNKRLLIANDQNKTSGLFFVELKRLE